MNNKYIDPKTVVIKDHVTNNKKVKFNCYRDGQFWYETELGLIFPISLEEVTASKVTLLPEDKAILFMRWIRKYVESAKNE
jgi:hypothetical protein